MVLFFKFQKLQIICGRCGVWKLGLLISSPHVWTRLRWSVKVGDLVRINHANLPRCNAMVIGTYEWDRLPALVVYSQKTGEVRIAASKAELLSESR
jgi:hypothetical protein